MSVSPPTAARTSTWHVVVPVKSRFRAKSRLHAPAGVDKPGLALALALDTLDAVLDVVRTDRLIVVTEDDLVTAHLAERDVRTVPDPARGLNPAVQAGLAEAVRRDAGLPTAVLLGDLPALRPAELLAGLRACAATESALVPDHDGHGTVLLTHHDPRALAPRFGRGSAARHARRCTVLDLDLPTLRHDVDDLASLDRAAELGLGEHSAAALGAERRSA
ncbi:2-phospho-L-lactate guanylyltransferase [Barrientosiimonas humi]|uniref:Phosphoenolpyruvate guanylyltransferase n=1 Tax=Barrientosiimonas humi TaxID=999931 RepID=A0A542XD93_9MICO|nr:2-phospho-L-lactate guanylyltransferase [Barrientosiimonas humi]TQL33775.1 2-phospho-L-lactate guanylyltransferase [Barrientosiimonas humi]CAG7573763.1 2-phospho-L-lactate guanylyltransferase [Barrientosiimonas humi]